MTDYIVKDIFLADFGRKELDIAETEMSGLNRPIYQRTAAYGHFGRSPEADGGFSWERTDLVDALKAAVA